MTDDPTPRWRRRLLGGLCWLLAAAFLVGAVTKFLPGETFAGPPYSEKFADWGYPSWFRFVVGAGELVGAVCLVIPRRRFLGAAVLGVILVGAVVTHIVNQDPVGESAAAPVNLALVALVAWASRPEHRSGDGLWRPTTAG
jgi:uncharacterized membrane protein YphA (DoxX/SURF4 family)